MTQNLLDTTTLLLNSTKSDINLGTGSKNYTETFSNGKSFNDILSTANNNLMKDNKLNQNTLSKNNNFNNNNNNNSKNLSEARSNKTDMNNTVSNPNKNSQTSQNASSQMKTTKSNDNNNSLSKSDTKSTKSEDVSAKTTEDQSVTSDSSETALNNEVEYNVNLSNVNIDLSEISDTENLTDLQDLNQLLLDDEIETDTAQADFYINAYYQSAIDSLQQPEMTDTEQDVLVQEDVLSEIDLQEVDTLATTAMDDTAKNLSLDEEETLSTTGVQDNLKTSTETEDVLKTTNKDLEPDKTKLKAETSDKKDLKTEKVATNEKEQSSVQNDAEVEVDTFTNEENVNKKDVLVNASENVIQNAQAVDVSKADSKLSFRDVMEKAGLDEAKLEALQLNVTESSNSESFNGNLGQGSAQDDVAKIAFETQGKKDAASIQNKDFSKLVDKKQTVDEQPKELSKNDILNQINSKMQAQNINGTKRIVLQLTPESLGKITVEIMKGKDGLQAKMLTDNFQVKELLEKNIDGLKSTLANQGVTVNNVSVKVASASESSSEFSFGRNNFNEENSQQQDFAGTGERRGENESHYEKNMNPEFAMEDETSEDISTENLISEAEEEITDAETEKIAVGVGNVDIEV